MAKLCFLFVAVICAAQLALALRLPRETGTTLEDAFTNIQKGLESTFTQENFKKLTDSVSAHAEELNAEIKKTLSQENLKKLSDSVSDQANNLNTQLKNLAANVGTKIDEFSKSDGEEKKSK